MNKLEKYISDNKNLFDEEPVSGHFERLQEKMNRKSRRIVVLRWSISVAASVAIIFLAGVLWQQNGKNDDMMLTCENAIDMKQCYLTKMNDVANRIEILTKNFDPYDQQELMTDVQNIINMADNGIENEIPEELSETKAKEILSDYYRQNLESLEMIEKQL